MTHKNTPKKFKKEPPVYWSMNVDDVRILSGKETLAAIRWSLRHNQKFSRSKRPHDDNYLVTRVA